MSMDVMVNNESFRWLQVMKGYDTLKIQKVGGSSQEIRNLQISAPSDEMGDYFLVTLTFEDPDIIDQSGCCGDRKSTRLNSSHVAISYAVFCLKKKKKNMYLD